MKNRETRRKNRTEARVEWGRYEDDDGREHIVSTRGPQPNPYKTRTIRRRRDKVAKASRKRNR